MPEQTKVDSQTFEDILEALNDALPDGFGALVIVAPEHPPGGKMTVSVASTFDLDDQAFLLETAREEIAKHGPLDDHEGARH